MDSSRRHALHVSSKYDICACKYPLLSNLGRQIGVQDSAVRNAVDALTKLNIKCKSETKLSMKLSLFPVTVYQSYDLS